MKRLFLSAALCALLGGTASAQFGNCTPSEKTTYVDAQTGRTITVLTDTLQNDRFLYQTDPMWTSDGKYLIFRSSTRAGDPEQQTTTSDGKTRRWTPTQMFFIEVATGRIIQATEGTDLGGVYLARKSNRMFISRSRDGQWTLSVMDLDRFFADVNRGKVGRPTDYERTIGTFPKEMGRPGGFAVDCNDDFAYITVERDGTPEELERMKQNAFRPEGNQPIKIQPTLCGIRKMNLETGRVEKVIDTEFKVGHIQACDFTQDPSLPDTFLILFTGSWGWGTWQRAWQHFCPDGQVLLDQLEARHLTRRFDFGGKYPFTRMLRRQIAGRNNSWAIRWNASLFLKGILSLNVGRSLVQNEGFDGSGTHCGGGGLYSSLLYQQPLPVTRITPVVENEAARRAFARYYARTNSFWAKVRRRLLRTLRGDFGA